MPNTSRDWRAAAVNEIIRLIHDKKIDPISAPSYAAETMLAVMVRHESGQIKPAGWWAWIVGLFTRRK